jgi:hypothetical protein
MRPQQNRSKVIISASVALLLLLGGAVWVLVQSPSDQRKPATQTDAALATPDAAGAVDQATPDLSSDTLGDAKPSTDARKKRRLGYRISDRDLRLRIRRYGGLIRVCYRLARRRGNKPVPRRVGVVLEVAAGGRVKRATIRGDVGSKLRACLTRGLRGWRFPAKSRRQTLRFPIVLAR